MARILAVGIAVLDVIHTVDRYPAEDQEVRALRRRVGVGGNAANTLQVLAQFAHECELAAVFAPDTEAGRIRAMLADAGVGLRHAAQADSGETPASCITRSLATGSRTIVHHRDLREFSIEDFVSIPIRDFDWIHFEGRNIVETRRMLAAIRASDFAGRVSLEVEKPRDGIESLSAYPDVIMVSAAYVLAHRLDAERALEKMRTGNSRALLTCSRGSHGALALDGERLISAPAYVPARVVDTVGAGDTFNAGVIHALLGGDSPEQALGFACRLAGRKVGMDGFAGLGEGGVTEDLFPRDTPGVPLAERLRPKAIADVVGQSHLLAPGKPLRLAFDSGEAHSMILWGPPGVGKTTLARLLAEACDTDFIAISAVLSGVKEIREAIDRAQLNRARGRKTILFVDEVHRFNKAQQDAFLPHVESGLFTFVGATTENPSFEVNSALLSRAQVYVLHALAEDDLAQLLDRAWGGIGTGPSTAGIALTDAARAAMVALADGDGRRLLNLVERVVAAARVAGAGEVDEALVRDAAAEALRRFDKGGDVFYDQISALHKSVRGSDPDAALYWMCRMLDGGCDPRYLARRMIRMASEDIGLADPRALGAVLDAAETYERLGSPEGELALAEAVLYLSCAPKSNAAYVAYNRVRRFIEQDGSRPVPMHLRNAPTKLMKNLGHGKDYRYAHDEPEAYAVGETYLPDDMKPQQFYEPTDHGLEAKIAEKLEHLRSLDREAKKR